MIADPLFLGALVGGALVYWLLPARFRNPFLVLLSCSYLGYNAPMATLAVVAWTVFFVWAAPRAREASRPRQVTGGLILLILGYLALFKYVPVIFDALTTSNLEASILMPLGISYYAFKLVHYAVEAGRGRLPEHTVWDALVWSTLFPAFTAGPIERFDHFAQHRKDKLTEADVAFGITRILHGLIKKLWVADTLLLPLAGEPDAIVGSLSEISTPEAWVYVVLMFLWGYMDFSAYSDIAIGSARLFGIELVENFNWPIVAHNITNFWKRWHMSLAAFCQAYVYMPAIGFTRSPYLAAYATFMTMGIWHGAAVNWLCWGLFHSTGVALHVTWTRYKRKRKWHKWMDKGRWRYVGILPTMVFVSAASAFTNTVELGGWAGLRLFAKLFFIG